MRVTAVFVKSIGLIGHIEQPGIGNIHTGKAPVYIDENGLWYKRYRGCLLPARTCLEERFR